MVDRREYVDFERPTKAYREDWHEYVLIPSGAYAPIVDQVSDERGACIIIEWQGEELAVDVQDL